MLGVLADRTYRKLFAAQVVALLGTGLATVALALLAYDLAGASAGTVLGTAMTIKMAAYVGVSPLVGAVADRLPRRFFLVSMDLVRAGAVLCLPLVDSVWQVYALIFVLQAASASFTPTFQAVIPEVLPDERDYTRALSLSRLAYDLENLLSPVLAAILLAAMAYNGLFVATALGFGASAALVASVLLPPATPNRSGEGVWHRTTLGVRVFLATPRLRALLAMNMAVAAATGFVIVNTAVIVRGALGRDETGVAIALGCYGAGSMLVALGLPRLLDRIGDRPAMLPAGFLLAFLLAGAAGIMPLAPAVAWPLLLIAWLLFGAGTALILTPGGRLLRRSCAPEGRPALFAAQFSLSHACFLVTYPLAGWLGAAAGMGTTLLVFAGLTLAAALLAAAAWPAGDPRTLPHVHAGLAPDHPHLRGAEPIGADPREHRHEFVIDSLHRRWPNRAADPVDTR